MGHEERFPSPSLSGRCRLGEATFARMGGEEEDAPIAVLRCSHAEWRGSTLSGHSLYFAGRSATSTSISLAA
jgi:hypothetical protein